MITARIAAKIFRMAEETAMLVGMDQQLKAYVLEGAFAVSEGRWVNSRFPLIRAQQDLSQTDPQMETMLAQLGWFARPNQPGYMNIYRYLREIALSFGKAKGLDRIRSESALTDLILRVGLRPKDGTTPVTSNARKTGVQFADRIKQGKIAPADLLPYLGKAVRNQILQTLKDRKKDETNRYSPRDDGEGMVSDPFERIRVDQDLPTLADAMMSAFHDPKSSVGSFLRTQMREIFEKIYAEKQKRRPNAPQVHRPALTFLDMLERNRSVHQTPEGELVDRLQVPSLADMGVKLNITPRAIQEAHIKPLFREFFEQMRRDPKIRNPLTRFFEKKGYPKEEIDEFFERENPFKIVSFTEGRPVIRVDM